MHQRRGTRSSEIETRVTEPPDAGSRADVSTDETRDVEQELAAGQSETTPVIALGYVISAVGALVLVALAIVVLAYVLA